MTYEKINYEAVTCYEKHPNCYQVNVCEVVDGEQKSTPILFHLAKREADEQANSLNDDLTHQRQVPIRFSWYWDSRVPVERRREIDRWYNSLTNEQRDMVDDMLDDMRAAVEDARD